jgi:hypothetical protein
MNALDEMRRELERERRHRESLQLALDLHVEQLKVAEGALFNVRASGTPFAPWSAVEIAEEYFERKEKHG